MPICLFALKTTFLVRRYWHHMYKVCNDEIDPSRLKISHVKTLCGMGTERIKTYMNAQPGGFEVYKQHNYRLPWEYMETTTPLDHNTAQLLYKAFEILNWVK